MQLKAIARRARQQIYEWVGNPKYSRPGLYDLDRKLEKYLDFENGFFIEAGANNGETQSNTYYLEKFKGWRGVLVEGIPELSAKARKRRPHARVFNCALVPFGEDGKDVEMTYGNLMSLVKGAQGGAEAEAEHLLAAKDIDPKSGSYTVKVPGRTLSSILDECGVTKIDFFSLDVEGFEAPVLQGLDFNRHLPRYMCIEARFRKDIEAVISPFYEAVEELTEMDVLYRARSL